MATRSGSGQSFSVLGSDLAVKGDIAASSDLHIDGSVDGDIALHDDGIAAKRGHLLRDTFRFGFAGAVVDDHAAAFFR